MDPQPSSIISNAMISDVRVPLSMARRSQTKSARTLYEKKDQVLELWIEKVKAEVDTEGILITPIIVNTIPLFIEKLAECLCEETAEDNPIDNTNFAQEHGGERARVTKYSPDQVIREFVLLREIILDTLKNADALEGRSQKIVQKSFDKAVQESMAAYFLVHARLREQFVAALTHDMRNPIGAIKMASELILDSVKDGPSERTLSEIHECNLRILKSVKRADRMIQDMLDASVVQIGESLTIRITPGNLAAIIHEAVYERPPAETANLKIETGDIQGYWDVDALQRSIENLISNAFKYGDTTRPITVKAAEAHGRVMVSVHNYGNPIPVEIRESLFQAFRRAEAVKKGSIKGWGIGLALARSSAELMGGSLGVESSAEAGTTFTLDIPLDARPFQQSHTSTC